MSGIPIFPDPKAVRPRLLLFPSTVLVLVSNLIPLAGVIYWGWDAFLILMFFWLETAVIAFWAMARVLAEPPGEGILTIKSRGRVLSSRVASPVVSRLAMVIFFTVHSGIFMTVHFVFLWTLFSGGWQAVVHGPGEFLDKIVLASGLWLPLAVSFLGRGTAFVFESARAGQVAASGRPPVVADEKNVAANLQGDVGVAIGGLYGRIVLMHIVILAGATLAQAMGSLAPFLLLIGLKTLFDVVFHVTMDLRAGRQNPAPAPETPGRAQA